ncbi:ROK family transcriptional regulator [Plantibacter flavus]|uniref:ROK family protein n=1 Tax=Plantibacter flavus TaxID=150123 RepID=UPI003F13BB5F
MPGVEIDASLGAPSRQLAREVLIHGPLSRAELGRRLGLSPASLTRLSRPYLDAGLFIDAPETAERAVGRPAKPLDVRIDAQRYLGIKVTGAEVHGVRTDLRANPESSAFEPLDGHDPELVVQAVVRLVDRLGGTDGLSSIGVSIGGKVADARRVVRAPFLGWHDVDLGGLLERRLGVPVVLENDVVALTAAEHWFGVAKGVENFAVITIGAGVGYGLVIHDRPVVTADTGLGLGGHFPLDPTGPLCGDGHRGCSSAMLAIPHLCASAGAALGREVGYDELLALSDAGDPVAVEVVGAALRALGRMIAASANLSMVDTVVLSGEGLALVDGRLDRVLAAVRTDRDLDASPVRVLLDDSGFSAWARGAAAVAIQASFG